MRQNWLPSLVCLLLAASLGWGLSAGALWDPHELSVAESARRIALNLLGGSELAIPGADNTVPIRAELGRGELPFTSAALGFRVFGLSEWAGRLPLVLWSALGLAALYGALARLADRRVAVYGIVILATTPLFFLQARTLVGDAVTLATFTIAWSGLAVAALAPNVEVSTRLLFGAVGVLGLYGGFWCRGPIISVAVPALAIGLAARFAPPASAPARWCGGAALGVGAAALALGALGLSLAQQTGEYSVFVGSSLRSEPSPTTFDSALSDWAHAAFPWSALAPIAIAVPWRVDVDRDGRRGTAGAAWLGLCLSIAASAWLAPVLGSFVLPAVGCFAALLALALRDVELRPRPLPLAGLACAALAVLLGVDLETYPAKALTGFGLTGVALPESLVPVAGKLFKWGGVAVAAVATLCLFERDEEPTPPLFQRSEYARIIGELQRLWQGNLVFAALVLEAALVGFLLLSAISERLVHLAQLDTFGVLSRKLVAVAAIAVPCSALVPLAALSLRDLGRLLFARRANLPTPTRAQGVLGIAATIGLVASLGFYPSLSRQVAPKQVFERYRQLGRPGEALGMLGDASVSARYQAGTLAQQLDSPSDAFAWLEAGGTASPRRWLLVRAASLAELNANYRERYSRNLPILDARSSELLLASNRLRTGERDESPLAGLVSSTPPTPEHVLRAVFGNKLEVLGWTLQDRNGHPATRMTAAATYRLSLFLRVLAPLSGNWQTFVHLDGAQRRFNADHPPLAGRYPISAWRPGDFLVDTTELELEPNFSPGQYRLYFGFFSGARRLEVTEGPAADHRVAAGTVPIE